MAIGRGQVVCVPTDTIYGLVADAFKPSATQALRRIRGMSDDVPLSVLVPGIPTLRALAEQVPDEVASLVAEFWPGALTIITAAGESLQWDLGQSKGTVALRMPSNRVVLELLSETGPLVASSAYRVGDTGGVSAEQALATFGDDVAVYLSSGVEHPEGALSTVIDATGLDKPGGKLRVVREGTIPASDIYQVVDASRFG
jgi:tRNA threonylcarbamoyl adenosine modification protein (Sua5/YciO/YrdC/YwlC family)